MVSYWKKGCWTRCPFDLIQQTYIFTGNEVIWKVHYPKVATNWSFNTEAYPSPLDRFAGPLFSSLLLKLSNGF